MKLPRILLVALAVMLSSCAGKFTQAQRQQLATVSVVPTGIKQGAYSDPYAGSQQARAAGGATGGLIGALVGEGIAAAQNSNFAGKNQSQFANVRKNTPVGLNQQVNAGLVRALKNNSFFASRVTSNSPNKFASTVNSYRLMRTTTQGGDILLAPTIMAEIQLVDQSGAAIWKTVAFGQSSAAYPISVYANNSKQSHDAYANAVQNLIQNFSEQLGRKTAD